MTQKPAGKKIVATNKRARHEYELLEFFEAGLVLTGTEIKSVRQPGEPYPQLCAAARR